LGVIFSGSVRIRHSGKVAISAKKRAGRNLPSSKKEVKKRNPQPTYHEILFSQAKNRPYALLHKTMAAGLTANEEQLDLHKIDRSGVVSKYVGETEKNLSQIFLKAWPN
jgi:hypothetical protein